MSGDGIVSFLIYSCVCVDPVSHDALDGKAPSVDTWANVFDYEVWKPWNLFASGTTGSSG